MREVDLSRAEFLQRMFQQAKSFARAWRNGEPEYRLPTREIGAAPTMKVVGGRPVYLWWSGQEIFARSGQCPKDGLSLYARPQHRSDGSVGHLFLCPACGPMPEAALTQIRVVQEEDWVRLELP